MTEHARLRGVTVRYGDRVALDGVSLTVRAGERVALLGPSGAGKSTLLGVLNGLVLPAAGAVEVLGTDPRALSAGHRRRLQARIGTVQQQLQLVGPLRVVHNVNAGRLGQWSTARALWSLLRPQGADEARAALASLGIADRLHDRTDQLSGGQQQRVALARVLAQRPDLVLADEPVSSLDPALAREVVTLLTGVVGAGRTVIASLHDVALAREHFDRLVGVVAGRVVLDRPAGDVGDADVAWLYARGAR